ncbi:unnamed protein product [Discosporangium mesarthrocarpum]
MSMSPRHDEDDGVIHIPVRGAELTIEVLSNELPTDYNLVVDALKAEIAPLDIWLRFAVEYHRRGKVEHFRAILNEIIGALNPQTETFYSSDMAAFEVGRIRILNALAADAVKRASSCRDRATRDQDFLEALDHLTSADRIDNMSELTWVGKGVFYLSQGELDRAKYFFENARKKRDNFPATLGEAAISYHNGNYKQALDLYSEAIRLNPGCSDSVRVGLGLCCYKLGQVERAKAAMKRALDLNPENVEAMVGLAILDLSSVTPTSPDATSRTENALRMLSQAHHLDSSNAMALNHLANHYFWTWSQVGPTVSVAAGAKVAVLSTEVGEGVVSGDMIRIGSSFATVVDGEVQGRRISLRDRYRGVPGEEVKLYKKDYGQVMELASQAYNTTSSSEIKAESCYMRARVHHATGNFSEAKLLYSEACNFWPHFAPAQYGMAQMLIYKGDIKPAMAALNAVLEEVPDSEEALVLLGMLHAKNKQRTQALAKFKRALELNPRLSDVWIAQAQVLQEDSLDHHLALASYAKGLGVQPTEGNGSTSNKTRTGTAWAGAGAGGGAGAMNGDQGRGQSSTEDMLHETQQSAWMNIAVLNERVGKLTEARAAYECALERKGSSARDEGGDGETVLRVTDPANPLFWEWKELPGTSVVAEGSRVVQVSEALGGAIRKGVQVRVGKEFVTTAQGSEVDGKFEVSDVAVTLAGGAPLRGKLYKKTRQARVTKENVSITFNLALLHEKQGHHEAAQELHKAILAEHPTYVHSYLRLGTIARDSGQIHESSKWFKQALDIDNENPDILAYIGNLHMRSSEWGPAQKKFERILEMPSLRGDSYAMLSLGNIYFSNLEDRTKYEKHLQHAANFYQEVLKEDDANAYSANGLGMVLAEKGMLDQAKEVFARVREVSAEVLGDVWINLAHVYLAQNKHNEAIRLYQNCLKKFHGGRDSSLHIYLAHAYFDARQYDECMRTLLKALHVSPNNLQLWYNLALTRETYAVAVLQKEQKGEARTLMEVENAIKDLKGATKLFMWLKQCQPDRSGGLHRRLPYDSSKADKHAKFCFDNIERADQHLSHEKMKADQQQTVRERHQLALEKMVQQRKREEEDEKARKANEALQRQERARLKHANLTKLQEAWTHVSKPEPKHGRGGEQSTDKDPQYESESGEEGDVSDKEGDDDTGQADRYGDGGGRGDGANKAEQPPVTSTAMSANLKDIGLSSSDSEDELEGGEEEAVDGGGKRKWGSDEESLEGEEVASKKRAVLDGQE